MYSCRCAEVTVFEAVFSRSARANGKSCTQLGAFGLKLMGAVNKLIYYY